MTIRGGWKQVRNKHIQIEGFDFAGIQYHNENTKETGWHIQVNLADSLWHNYWVSEGQFYDVTSVDVPLYPAQPVVIGLGGIRQVDSKEKEAALEAIKIWENPATQL
jgi:hypothetical protein